jgi:hypothetical protein
MLTTIADERMLNFSPEQSTGRTFRDLLEYWRRRIRSRA